jgi:transposase-like protein
MQWTADMQAMRDAGDSYQAIARKVGVAKSTVQKAYTAHQAEGGKPAKAVASAPEKKVGRSLNEFRLTYDKDTIVPARIRAALRELGQGWEYEAQFVRLAGVSAADLGNYRDQFADHVVSLRESRRAWAGTTATAKAMREML